MLAAAHRQVLRAAVPRSSALLSTAAASFVTDSAAAEILHLELRPAEGSRAARRLRKQGYLPGILYGEDVDGNSERVLVALQTRTFEKVHRKLWTSIENQVFNIQVGENEPIKAIMRDVQFDVVTDVPLAVNFLRYRPGHKVRIPITYLNEEGSPGLKRGGYINHIHHELECYVHTDKVPATLQVDVNGLHVGDRIFLDAIEIPAGIEPVIPAGSLVAKIAGRRGLIPRAEPVVEVVEEVVEEEVVDEEFDEWNDIF